MLSRRLPSARSSKTILLQSQSAPRVLRGALSNRSFYTSRLMSIQAQDIALSPGQDEGTRNATLQSAMKLVNDGDWKLCNNGKGFERGYRFKTFNDTWEFMSSVAAECKKQRHHPEWTNVYNRLFIRWTTHSPEGLSRKDVSMAEFCDHAVRQFSGVEVFEGFKAQ